MPKPAQPPPPVIQNRKAKFEYEVLEKLECGIVLTGSEVKSLREGRASLDEAFAVVRGEELWLRACTIQPYSHAGEHDNHDPTRDRKLLARKAEIRKLHAKVMQKGLTLAPLRLGFNDRGLVKVRIGLVRGKKLHDKRETIKKRDADRHFERIQKSGGKPRR